MVRDVPPDITIKHKGDQHHLIDRLHAHYYVTFCSNTHSEDCVTELKELHHHNARAPTVTGELASVSMN